jgi:endogenous inhibitor of DNA gyrase (YacG/DUF329 family)
MNISQKCPSCKVKTNYGQHSHYPFCSAKCRDSDFLEWNNESKILSTPITDADEALEAFDSNN